MSLLSKGFGGGSCHGSRLDRRSSGIASASDSLGHCFSLCCDSARNATSYCDRFSMSWSWSRNSPSSG